MTPSLTALAYLVAAVLFILALRGLSNPTSSRQGNAFGMAGMAIAVLATLLRSGMSGSGYVLIFAGIIIGGAIGVTVSRRIQMTALPQLVAAFHSLVGLGGRVRGRRGLERNPAALRHRRSPAPHRRRAAWWR